jgi:hypothetical protein
MVEKKQKTSQPNIVLKRPKSGTRAPGSQKRPSRSRKTTRRGVLGWLGIGKKAPRTVSRYTPPPVVVRGVPAARRTGEKGQSGHASVRRRFDVNVPTAPEATVTLPSLPAIRFSWRILSFGLTAGLLFALYYLWTSPFFMVTQVELTGLQRIKPYDLNAILGAIDKPSFLLVPDRMEDVLLERFPALTSASVEVEFPNLVLVEVQERTPLLIWMQGGRTDFVDADGFAFPLGNSEQDLTLLDFPVVEAEGFYNEEELTPAKEEPKGFLNNILAVFRQDEIVTAPIKPRQILTPDMVKAILLLRDHAPQDSPLLFTEAHGLAWEDQAGWMVYFGDARHIEMKLRVYQTILRYLSSKEEIPELVSVEWVDAPYYRLEP